MPIDRFYIGPYDSESGLENDIKPFLLPEKAFASLNNAYCWRGRIRKRFGTRWLGQTQQTTRLRMTVATITSDAASGTVPGTQFNIGQEFSIGTNFFTVYQTGVTMPMLINGTAATATFSTTNGAFSFTGVPVADTTPVYWYPAQPVMGMATFQNSIIDNEPLIAFDTQFAYQYSNGWERIGTGAVATWTGSNSQYFWFATWVGVLASDYALFVTNFNQNEPQFMRYLLSGTWNSFAPIVSNSAGGVVIATTDGSGNASGTVPGGIYLVGQKFVIGIETDIVFNNTPGPQAMNSTGPSTIHTFDISNGNYVFVGAPINTKIIFFPNVVKMIAALLIIPFKNRLLAFNVWESTNGNSPVQYANRLRFTTVGSPIDNLAASPPYSPWNSDTGNIGGAIDCPMQEAIVTVQYIKDRLIVGMETSSWEIVFTNNQVYPFMWQQINTELGSESTFSVVPFDKVVLSIGNVGIIACTGANVDRIDAKIPDEVFKIQNVNSGIQRVYGIRDYFAEMVYWTFPDDSFSATFPYMKKVLVYNYKNGTWSFNDDSFTVFGYFQPQAGVLWSDTTVLWSDEVPWDSGSLETVFRQTAAGNQEGWTFILDTDSPVNAASLQITNITNIVSTSQGTTFNITSIDYNMNEGDYILLNGISGTGNLNLLNGLIVQITAVNLMDANNFTVDTTLILVGVYSGGGTIARVSNINFLTKQYNFYLEKGRNFYVHRVDFLVDKTAGGQTQLDYYVSTSDVSMVGASSPQPLGSGSIVGTSILETTPYINVPFEQTSSQLWHPLYFQGDGQFIQLYFYFNDDQMRSSAVMQSDFQLHAMLFWAQKTSQWFR